MAPGTGYGTGFRKNAPDTRAHEAKGTQTVVELIRRLAGSRSFPAGAVLAAVAVFWLVGLLGGLSLLSATRAPLVTLGWMLFVYALVGVSPLLAFLAAADLIRLRRARMM